MGKEAVSIGADTFQFFTRNPRGGNAKTWNSDDALALRELMRNENFAPVLAHAPYTLNPCSQTPETVDFAKRAFSEDLRNLELIPEAMYNFHPGSHTGAGTERGIAMIADLLNEFVTTGTKTTVLLETMAGKGSEVGKSFEELASILSLAQAKEKIGICLDTCHVYDGGYDLRDNLEMVLEQFDRIIGISKLRAVHLNDSKNPIGSRKDRHEKIGEGSIGIEAFGKIINHPALRYLPFFLETPNELPGYQKEIETLRALYRE